MRPLILVFSLVLPISGAMASDFPNEDYTVIATTTSYGEKVNVGLVCHNRDAEKVCTGPEAFIEEISSGDVRYVTPFYYKNYEADVLLVPYLNFYLRAYYSPSATNTLAVAALVGDFITAPIQYAAYGIKRGLDKIKGKRMAKRAERFINDGKTYRKGISTSSLP